MIFKLNYIELKRLYSWLLIVILSSFSLFLFTHRYIRNNYFILGITVISGVALAVVYLLLIQQSVRYKEDIFNIFFIIFFVIFGLYFRDLDIVVLGVLAQCLLFVSGKEIIKIYGISQAILVVFLLILAFFKFIPLFSTIQNGWLYDGGALALDFGINKNLVGIFLFNIAMLLFVSEKLKFYLQCIIFSVIEIIIIFLIRDRTVGVILFLFFICYVFKKNKINTSRLSKVFIVLLPLFLIILSLFLSFNYGKKDWINEFNAVLSGRIQFWNYFWNQYSLKLWPQDLTSYFNMYTFGYISSIQYPVDGFYSLGLLKEGIIAFGILIIMMIYTLHNLLKNENRLVFLVMFSMILISFSENIALSYGYICYLFPYILGAFSRKTRKNY
ncbi:hypothetical protein [Peptostreptococcus porci]|uniref:hypothetical protein n=1 Tax=Peptostreptococcus porci TaxID=2652282 RepID=UPI002A90C038|nr:hypothetical protein [Peptostreptococcus porci]MDY5436857.1 hypothetical protein [Peptostreptococcus porci]